MSVLCYRKNGGSIVTESINGEVVIINLDSGESYSREGAGAFAWDNFLIESPSRRIRDFGIEEAPGRLP